MSDLNYFVKRISQEAQKYPELQSLEKNTSKMAFWTHLKHVMAAIAQELKLYMDTIKESAKREHILFGTAQWWIENAKAFQYGDYVKVVNGKIGYQVPDLKKQIVKYVAVEAIEGGGLKMKIAKEKGKALDTQELQAFTAYMEQVKLLGIDLQIISQPATPMKLVMSIEVDKQVAAQILNPNLTESPTLHQVITQYYETQAFNSTFYLSKLIDEIQKIEGVKDVFIESAQYRTGTGTGTEYHDIKSKAISPSGFFNLHSKSQITYIVT